MISRMNEMCLYQYFTVETVLGPHLENPRALYDTLLEAFCVKDGDADRVFSQEVAAIRTKNDYYQYRRIGQYLAMVGKQDSRDPLTEEIISVKGEAILAAEEHRLKSGSDMTGKAVFDALSDGRFRGDLMAMRIRGLLQCEGIFMNRSLNDGIRQLRRCAAWDDLASLVLCLHYDAEQRPVHLARLKAVAEGTPYEEPAELCAAKYGIAAAECPPERKLLRRAIFRGILRQDVYDPACDRILQSTALSLKEKETLVLSGNKALVNVVSELPLSADPPAGLPFDRTVFDAVPYRRPAETERILQILGNTDLCAQDSYKPLCISCDSPYVLQSYAKNMKAANDRVNITVLQAPDLGEQDLEHTEASCFLRSFRENCRNVYFLVCTGKMNPGTLEHLKAFLETKNRREYRLKGINVAIDLGSALPVVFCDTANEMHFTDLCDVVRVAGIQPDEMETTLSSLLEEKKARYGLSSVSFAENLAADLYGISADRISDALDSAIRQHRADGGELTVTYEMLSEFLEKQKRRTGFGFEGGY